MTSAASAIQSHFGRCFAWVNARTSKGAGRSGCTQTLAACAGQPGKYNYGGSSVKLRISKWSGAALCCAVAVALLGTLLYAASTATSHIPLNEKVKVTGVILSRSGDTIRIKDKKSGQFVVVNITDNTKIERKKGHVQFFRHTDMDMTALLPGLTVEAEGRGDAKGRLAAEKISFSPDEFALAVTEQQEIVANRKAAKEADRAAQQGMAVAAKVQSSADQATVSANRAEAEAQIATEVGLADATAAAMLNKRVSELDNYKNEFEVDVFFARDSSVLDEKSKKDLDNLADIARSLDGYMIEIAGYSSNTLSKEADQKLSEERAAVVAQYLREEKDIPMRRILVPVGYGATHPAVGNKDPYDRELNRHVDIKILVNQSFGQGL
jgi:outer membrane protein OmpA-like peptidoglycan-associated protein